MGKVGVGSSEVGWVAILSVFDVKAAAASFKRTFGHIAKLSQYFLPIYLM